MLKNYRKGILITWLIVLTLAGFLASSIVFATANKYSLSDKEVVLDGINDGEVEIAFSTSLEGAFYAIEATWGTKEEVTSYFTLTSLTPNSGANPSNVYNNNIVDGKILYDEPVISNGFNVDAGGTLWTAKYKVDKDTPEGEYEIKIHVDAVMSNMDESEDFTESCVVTVTRKTSIVPIISGYESNYEYTGNKIEPEITVKDYITSVTLEEDIDYAVTYGSNKEIGTGTITVHPVESSTYLFEETTVNFNINRKTLTEENVICPESIRYTGSQLNPEVLVKANNKALTVNTDYTITFTNLNGGANEVIGVTVQGIGNYTGTVSKEILITPKPPRDISYIDDMTMVCGDTMTVTKSAPYEITYTSYDDSIVSVTHSYDGTVNTNSMYANSVGYTLITVTYAETEEYAETTQTFSVTVNKRSIIIESAEVEDKVYDGTKTAVVSSVTLKYPVSSWELGTDYTATAEFDSANAGTRNANVVVTLLGDAANNYKFKNGINTINAGARITPLSLEGASVYVSDDTIEYNGNGKTPDAIVTKNGNQLEKNVDYTLGYENNINAGNGAIVIATGKNNYSGSATGTFTINPYSITESNVSLEYTRVRYNGEYREPTAEVYINGHKMPSTEYTVAYNNNKEIGTAEAIIIASSSNFKTPTGGVVKNFEIVGQDVLEISGVADNQSITYTGREVTLVGSLKVANNSNNIGVNDLVTTWYDEDGNNISRPINVGKYSVQYNYSDIDYIGNLTINFEIVKAHSGYPVEAASMWDAMKGDTLSTIPLSTPGLAWQNPGSVIERGTHTYRALFTRNNDTNNYLTETINISVRGRENIVPEVSGIETEYIYTGGQIKPGVVVKIYGTQTVLTPDTDYTVEYGGNTNCGRGTITIKPVASSDFIFTEVTTNLGIVPCEILIDEVAVQSTIDFQGHELTPVVRVFKNGYQLVEDTDYTVSYSNQDGEIGTEIMVTVTGKGNYKGEIVKGVRITAKSLRNVAPIDNTTIEYGRTKEYISVEDCEVSFTSSNPEVLSITHEYTGVSSYNTIKGESVGEAIVTVTYPETNNYAETIQTFEVEVTKKSLTIRSVEVEDKVYDGTTDATVTNVVFGGANVDLENGVDYTVEAEFQDPNAGKDKDVSVTVSLTDNSSSTYQLESNSFNATADIKVASILNSSIFLEYTTIRNDGTAKEPAVTVKTNGEEISPENYAVAYRDNDRAGTAKVIIRGIGNYSGEVTKEFEIVDKKVIGIGGIENNQRIEYTGEEVVLEGTVTVSPNDEGVTVDNLTEKWFNSSNQEINKPIDAGKYRVEYSYSSDDSAGSLVVNFEITKADSGMPPEAQRTYTEVERNKLNSIKFETEGLAWKDENTTITKGNKRYVAKYTKNNDTKNYETKEIGITVYGKALVRVNTRVNGTGGSVSNIEDEVLEGEEVNIRFTPEDGYEIEKVTLNGKEVKIANNELTYIAGSENASVVVTYKKIEAEEPSEEGPSENNTNTNTNINSNTNTNINTNTNTNTNSNTNSNTYTNNSTNSNTSVNTNVVNNVSQSTNTNTNTNTNSNTISTANVGNVMKTNTAQSTSVSSNEKIQTTKEKTPATGTNLNTYIILAITSFVGFISTFIYNRKNRSNIY